MSVFVEKLFDHIHLLDEYKQEGNIQTTITGHLHENCMFLVGQQSKIAYKTKFTCDSVDNEN